MKKVAATLVTVGFLMSCTGIAWADDVAGLWRVTFDTHWLGPMDAHVGIQQDAGGVRGKSLSGSTALLRQLPGDHDVEAGLMVFTATAGEKGTYTGTFLAPWHEGDLTLTIENGALTGSVEGGAFAGTLTGTRVESVAAIRDYGALLDRFDAVVASKIFAPGDLLQPGYLEFRARFGEIAAAATDDLDLLFGFHLSWKNDPFSHFQLKRSHQTAEQIFRMFDSYRVGFDAATVEFEEDTAILKVRTMMGADTIEQIEQAYDRIAEQQPKNLIIDLRGNSGGAFAVKPLVEHVIDEPLEAGFFLSQIWTRNHNAAPSREEALAAPQWSGWSIISFWNSVQEQGITRVRFQPAEPNYDGNVYVLVDGRSASATELAVDAFRAAGVTTIVGERTAGEMLSQSMFDVVDGFIVSLPVADYYSIAHGRIEGQGVPVDIESESSEALRTAEALAASR